MISTGIFYLVKALYKRWINYDSIYSIVTQGMLMITSQEEGFLIDNFLTEYTQMMYLELVQRASLIKFKREAVKLAANVNGRGKNICQKSIIKIMDLQERFIAFSGQLCFEEVSPQEQAIEMYDMMKEAFHIDKLMDSLENLIRSMYEAADTTIGFKVNKVALLFTWISGIIAFIALISDLCQVQFGDKEFFNNRFGESFLIYTLVIGFFLMLICIVKILYDYKRRK